MARKARHKSAPSDPYGMFCGMAIFFIGTAVQAGRLQVSIVCGGSYRHGKACCGDIVIVITHPDGKRCYIHM